MKAPRHARLVIRADTDAVRMTVQNKDGLAYLLVRLLSGEEVSRDALLLCDGILHVDVEEDTDQGAEG